MAAVRYPPLGTTCRCPPSSSHHPPPPQDAGMSCHHRSTPPPSVPPWSRCRAAGHRPCLYCRPCLRRSFSPLLCHHGCHPELPATSSSPPATAVDRVVPSTHHPPSLWRCRHRRCCPLPTQDLRHCFFHAVVTSPRSPPATFALNPVPPLCHHAANATSHAPALYHPHRHLPSSHLLPKNRPIYPCRCHGRAIPVLPLSSSITRSTTHSSTPLLPPLWPDLPSHCPPCHCHDPKLPFPPSHLRHLIRHGRHSISPKLIAGHRLASITIAGHPSYHRAPCLCMPAVANHCSHRRQC